jgi:rRNA small subunit pseudouridine methyltransferase Nep1
LLSLLDSPLNKVDSTLNKAGKLQIYIHTTKNVLIKVNPQIRIPRTFKRFCGLIVQLLHKLSIRAVNGPDKLLSVVKNPISDHLPPDAIKISILNFNKAMSSEVPPIKLSSYLPTLAQDKTLVFFIGAMSHGHDDWCDDIIDEKISISEYPLSAAITCSKLVRF